MFIQRDYNRLIKDDFDLNVKPLMGPNDGAVPVYYQEEENVDDYVVVGWRIKPLYE